MVTRSGAVAERLALVLGVGSGLGLGAEEDAAVPPRLSIRWRETEMEPGGVGFLLVFVFGFEADPLALAALSAGNVLVRGVAAGPGAEDGTGGGEGVGRFERPGEETAGLLLRLLFALGDEVDRLDLDSATVFVKAVEEDMFEVLSAIDGLEAAPVRVLTMPLAVLPCFNLFLSMLVLLDPPTELERGVGSSESDMSLEGTAEAEAEGGWEAWRA